MSSDDESYSSSSEDGQAAFPAATGRLLYKHEQVLAPAQGGVYMPYQELPLPGERAGRVPPRTIRFIVQGPFKRTDQPEAADSILEQVKTQLSGCTAPTISFPHLDEAFKCVDLTFVNRAQFAQVAYKTKLSLCLKGYYLPEWLVGAELEPFEVPVVIKQKVALPGVPASASKEVLGQLARACNEELAAQGHVIEGWAEFRYPSGQPHLRKWTGKLICLFHLEEGQSLPTSLQLGQSQYSLAF